MVEAAHHNKAKEAKKTLTITVFCYKMTVSKMKKESKK